VPRRELNYFAEKALKELKLSLYSQFYSSVDRIAVCAIQYTGY